MRDDIGQVANPFVYGNGALSFAEVLAVRRKPSPPYPSTASHIQRIDGIDGLTEMLSPRVIGFMDRDRFWIVVYGDVDRSTHRLLCTLGGAATTGKVINEDRLEDHAAISC
jgi:hypothetical protein